MQKHPEGGYFAETFRDDISYFSEVHNAQRNVSTLIYYLVTPDNFSGLHLVKSNECFHFYLGDMCQMLQITEAGEHTELYLGTDFEKGARPQVLVPKNIWQATRLVEGGEYALFGCSVAPGFHYDDFINGSYESMVKLFPDKVDLIKNYTNH